MDYQKEYLLKNPDLHRNDSRSKAEAVVKVLGDFHKNTKSIVDVACGSGDVLASLVSYLKLERAVGIDISKAMIDTAQKHQLSMVDWICSDIFNVNLENFDLVIGTDIVEHVENDLAFLQHIKKFGRYIVLKVPIEENLVNSLFKYISFGLINEHAYTKNKYGHLHHYSLESLFKIINDSGLEIISKNYMPLPKRSLLFWEVLRVATLPIWYMSSKVYLKISGGFVVLLLSCKDHETS